MFELNYSKRLSPDNVKINFGRGRVSNLFATILVFGMLIISSQSMAQSLENKDKIIDYLGMEKFSSLENENPSFLEFLDARYSHGYHMMDYVAEKMSDFPVLDVIYRSELTIVDINNKPCEKRVESKVSPEDFLIAMEGQDFNFLEYRFTFDRTEVTYHVLGNSGKVIMIVPIDKINRIVNVGK